MFVVGMSAAWPRPVNSFVRTTVRVLLRGRAAAETEVKVERRRVAVVKLRVSFILVV